MSSVPTENHKIFSGIIKLDSEEVPYGHLPHDCKPAEALSIMIKDWQIHLPKIMLLIVSDNGPLRGWDSYKEQENFVKGLIKGSNATSMWIFTSGLNIGISKVIGDAYQQDYNKRHSQICYRHTKVKKQVTKPPLIGVCGKNLLTYQDKFETMEKVLNLESTGNKVEEQKFNLNPYHSHFFIIDDKTYLKDGCSRFLLQLVDALKLSKVPKNDSEKVFFPTSAIPIVAILIQGNLNSIHYILAHLKRKLPVLVIRGSGGLADVFAYAYHEVCRSFLKIKDKDYVETILRKGLRDIITTTFPGLKDNKMAQNLLCGRIVECIECSEPPELKYITVLSVLDLTCNMEDLPSYLLEALFKAEKSQKTSLHSQLRKDLQLTFDWNCPKIALSKVFYQDHTFIIENDIFEQALLQKGREAFVSIFLDSGFPLHKYLSAARLIKIFEHSLKENFFKEVCWHGILGYGEVIRLDNSFIDSDLNWIIESLLGIPVFLSAEELNVSSAEAFDESYSKDIAIDVAKRRALMALTTWALISNREKLTTVLWQHADQPIMTALAASLMLYKMKIYINDTKTRESIEELSKKFATIATGVFDLCYNDMPTKAYDSLNVRLKEWAGLSIIDMASLSQNRTFMAHSCCQKWLTNEFMGNIKIRELTWGFMTFPVYIKVILCSFLIFPMYLWVRFKETSIHEFVGDDDYENNDPYYIPEKENVRERKTREEGGRSHLLKYHYPPLWQMILWMWSAPITKFWVSNIFYITYLVIFSVAVIWPSCGNIYLDIIVCVWTSLIAVDSAYRMFAIQDAFPNTPLFGSCLEIIYMIFFVLFYVILRIATIPQFEDPYAGKILICVGLLCFYYRMIFIYLPISSTLGPLLYRVKEMITVDFINFMKLVVFVLIGNAIAMQAILYPDYPLIPELIRKSFHKAFFSFFLTPVEELTTTDPKCVKWEKKPTEDVMCRVSEYVDGKCSNGIAFWPYIIVFQFILLLKLILMTILFALFNATGARIGAEMDSIWKFQRYKLIVNFSYSLRLPPPLNIFSVIIIIYNYVVKCAKYGMLFINVKTARKVTHIRGIKDGILSNIKGVKDDVIQFLVDDKTAQQKYLPSVTYAYWKQLAKDYCDDRDQENEEEAYIKKELDVLSQLSEDLNMKEILIHRAKAQITQLEANICYTHAHLETLKYRAKQEEITKPISLHSLSRESPYPRTKIQRFPVPDKYVPWEVMWLHYEPSIYTMPKKEFSTLLRPYVDDDILLMKIKKEGKKDLPVYSWNLESVDANGVYRNRKSWITNNKNEPITYRLDTHNLPRNPMGRTGLCGKGALPRWGPNHNIFVVITRWKKTDTDKDNESLMETSGHLEYVETWFMKKKDLSLPGGFAWSENKYEVIQSCFKMDENSESWKSSDDMINFFKSHAVVMPNKEDEENDFTSRQVYTGYMDDQMNTDQAWKEVELWHMHYNVVNNLFKTFKANVRWRLLSEDVFIQLPYGQTTLLQDAIRPLNAKIAHM